MKGFCYMGLFGAENFLFFVMRVWCSTEGKEIVIRAFMHSCFGFLKDSTRFFIGM